MAIIGRSTNQAPHLKTKPAVSNHGSNGLRDEYDNSEDLYEDNPDWFEDEDEAWDEWEDG